MASDEFNAGRIVRRDMSAICTRFKGGIQLEEKGTKFRWNGYPKAETKNKCLFSPVCGNIILEAAIIRLSGLHENSSKCEKRLKEDPAKEAFMSQSLDKLIFCLSILATAWYTSLARMRILRITWFIQITKKSHVFHILATFFPWILTLFPYSCTLLLGRQCWQRCCR